MSAPELSIVIPTHNRRESLRRLLQSLERQTVPPERFEVIAVDDGGSDGTADELERQSYPFAMRVLRTKGIGPAPARNLGADASEARYILFLDDDLEAGPALIAEHLAAHSRTGAIAVTGPYLPNPYPTRNPYAILTRNWWEDTFRAMRLPGHRFTYQDVLSGNVSVPRETFVSIGRFHEGFREFRAEDWEFGMRLIRHGIPIVHAPAAAAVHYETASLKRASWDAWREGRGLAMVDRLHPFLAPQRATGKLIDGRMKRAVRVAASCGAIGTPAITLVRWMLWPLAVLRLRRTWQHAYGLFRLYWLWRGYLEPLDQPLDATTIPNEASRGEGRLDLDLAGGLEAAEHAIDAGHPASLRLTWNGREIGEVPEDHGAEPLRGAHLRGYLEGQIAKRLAEVLSSA